MMNFYKDKKFLGALFVGAIGGYLYYYFIGCKSGSCPITSSATISTLYGAMIGGIAFLPSKKKKNNPEIAKTSEL